MTNNEKKRLISIILPTYNEEGNLPAFHKELARAAEKAPRYEFEFLFVDDCSTDRTPEVLEELRRSDKRVNIIRLARNSGVHAAIGAGCRYCRGDAAIDVAVDMQDLPGVVIPGLLKEWEAGCKVVWGKRDRKKESLPVVLFSKAFYILMKAVSKRDIPVNIGSILMDRVVIDAVNRSQEKNSSVIMLLLWMGFRQGVFEYTGEPRRSGRSKWTFAKKMKLSFDSIISLSYVPLRFMSLLGFACMALGAVYGIYIFVNKVLHNIAVEGWSSIMIAILLIGGIQMMMLGVLGEYLWRAYDEIRPRPRYIIEKNTIPE